jgi:hypothetical protein
LLGLLLAQCSIARFAREQTIRGYADLADLAKAVGDVATKRWATKQAEALLDKAKVASATLNGSPANPKLVKTTRGLEAVAKAKSG